MTHVIRATIFSIKSFKVCYVTRWRNRLQIKLCDAILLSGEVISLAQADRTTSRGGGRPNAKPKRRSRSRLGLTVEFCWISSAKVPVQ